MRIFWSIVALLVIVTVVVFALPAGSGSASKKAPAPSATTPSVPVESVRTPEPKPAPAAEPEPVLTPETASQPVDTLADADESESTPVFDLDTLLDVEPETDQARGLAIADMAERGESFEGVDELEFPLSYDIDPDATPLPEAIDFERIDAGETIAFEANEAESAEAETKPHTPTNAELMAQLKEARERHKEKKAAESRGKTDISALVDPDVTWEDLEIIPGVSIKQRNTDGAYLVEDRHLIYGEGTKAKPYEVSWDMLYSVRETYRPRKGLEDIPKWTEWLDGKWVRITGFMATAVFAADVDELLIMKNEWDGCCIGVPPTPYDAVEVTLTEKIKLTAGMMSFGTITGKLDVEPYLVRNWLVGLYLLEEGTVEQSGF